MTATDRAERAREAKKLFREMAGPAQELVATEKVLTLAEAVCFALAFADAEREAVIEECARVAEKAGGDWAYIKRERGSEVWFPGSPFDRGKQESAVEITTAIRNLKGQPDAR